MRLRGAVAVLVAALVATGCQEPSEDRTLTVLAAASLTDTFTALARDFEEDHPGVRVRLVFDSSATLAAQVAEGAPADVLATADERTIGPVATSGAVESPQVFATNVMVLATPAGDPAGVGSLRELARADFVACVETAPCGALARRLLDRNGVTAEPRSLEVDVRAVLAKVAADEADAGLVYATDARSAGDAVEVRPVPGAEQLPTRYPAAVVAASTEPELAREWVDLLLSADGQAVLAAAGFGAPG